VPGTQDVQTVAPIGDEVPSMQLIQLLADVCADCEL
jgi:hypothetical protein